MEFLPEGCEQTQSSVMPRAAKETYGFLNRNAGTCVVMQDQKGDD